MHYKQENQVNILICNQYFGFNKYLTSILSTSILTTLITFITFNEFFFVLPLYLMYMYLA